MRPDVTLSVIIPVFNEKLTVRALVERVRAVPIRKEILLVDDASTDGTADVLRALAADGEADPNNRIRAFFHAENAGKGAAVRTAIPEVTGDLALIQDADLEYDPSEYPVLIEPILANRADVVFGSRFLGGPHRVLFFRHSLGNRMLTLMSNLCTDLNLTDMETCYKVFRSEVLKRMHLVSKRFGIEPEITAKVARMGVRVYEVPISYDGREYWEGKKIGWKDGVAAVWTILRFTLCADGHDPGSTTLRRVRRARRYNEWVWSRIAPFIGDRVLEVGSGLGTFTRYLRNRTSVVATDNNPQYVDALDVRFRGQDNVSVRLVDWERPDLAALGNGQFDTVLCLNVLEHLERDEDALAGFAALLATGGRLVMQVPAMQSLYGEIDRALDHFRRYDREALTAALRRHGLEVERARYANLPGALAWYVNARLLRRRSVPGVQARFASAIVPWLRLEERFNPRWGMTLIVIARKVDTPPPAQPAAADQR